MHEYRLHAERVRDQARVLPGRTAEARQGVFSHVVPALHGNLLDRVRHVLDRDSDATGGDALWSLRHACRALDVRSECTELPGDHCGVQQLIAGFAEHSWKE